MIANSSDKLREIRAKVEAAERLTLDDGLFLYRPDVHLNEVGELANLVRERKNGHLAYYNINTHLNPTNVCVYRCTFCAFRSDLRDPKGYVMSDEQMLARGREAVDSGCTEMHIVGGLHHQWKYEDYRHVIEMLHQAYPDLHLKAWTAVEINWFQHLTKQSIRWILEDQVAAGLGSMPGGGAEIFHPEVRDQICEHKADARNWIEIHRTAHQLGLRTNATMLYGHIENAYHRVDHLLRLRELQDETHGFQTFIPLAFHPANTGLSHVKKPSALLDLRTMAISRLLLDNFDRSRWHRATRVDLPRCGGRNARGTVGRADLPAHSRGGARTSRTRHPVPSRGPRRRALAIGRADRRGSMMFHPVLGHGGH
jgi:aminodeoxyfutalosine synthase